MTRFSRKSFSRPIPELLTSFHPPPPLFFSSDPFFHLQVYSFSWVGEEDKRKDVISYDMDLLGAYPTGFCLQKFFSPSTLFFWRRLWDGKKKKLSQSNWKIKTSTSGCFWKGDRFSRSTRRAIRRARTTLKKTDKKSFFSQTEFENLKYNEC